MQAKSAKGILGKKRGMGGVRICRRAVGRASIAIMCRRRVEGRIAVSMCTGNA